MAIGVVNSNDFERELSKTNSPNINLPIFKSNVVSEATIIDLPIRGRGLGNDNVPESLRKIIGEESAINGRKSALALAESVGVSPSSVSAYNKGATSTATIDNPNQKLKAHIDGAKLRVSVKAKNRLMTALNCLTPDKIANAKAKDISSIAKDMSSVMKDMAPSSESVDVVNRPQFITYAPSFVKEEHFETIIVNDNY